MYKNCYICKEERDNTVYKRQNHKIRFSEFWVNKVKKEYWIISPINILMIIETVRVFI